MATLILSAIALIIQFLPGILAAAGVISPAIEALIQKLAAAIPALITSLVNHGTPTDDAMAVLEAFQEEIAALQTNSNLDADDLQTAATLEGAIADALRAYRDAGGSCDPSTLTRLPEQF